MSMNAHTGKTLAGDGHIIQSVRDILTTPIGSRVMRRTYGSRLTDLIDAPLNEQTTVELYAAVAEALRAWEPRITVTAVNLQTDTKKGPAGRGVLTLKAVRTSDGSPFIFEVPL